MTSALCGRSLKQHLQNIECNSTSAVAITHHFLTQLVKPAVAMLTVSAPPCLLNNYTYAAVSVSAADCDKAGQHSYVIGGLACRSTRK